MTQAARHLPFQVPLHVPADSADPPTWVLEGLKGPQRRFLFENAKGEQIVAIGTRDRFHLVCSAIGWDKPFEIERPGYSDLSLHFAERAKGLTRGDVGWDQQGPLDKAAFSLDELTWLVSVFMALTHVNWTA